MPGSVIAAVAVHVGYLVVVGVLWRVLRVDYLRVAETRPSAMRGIVVPMGAGLIVLVLATTVLGWWPDVMT